MTHFSHFQQNIFPFINTLINVENGEVLCVLIENMLTLTLNFVNVNSRYASIVILDND